MQKKIFGFQHPLVLFQRTVQPPSPSATQCPSLSVSQFSHRLKAKLFKKIKKELMRLEPL